jgi:uncharacterized membrane protein YhaH (DUF805 family)
VKGNVLGFDPETNTGAISGHDGNRYDFATQDWHGPARPRHGDLVDFQIDGRRAHEIYLIEPEYVRPGFWQFYFSSTGRISRSQYWLKFVVPVFVIGLVIGLLRLINGEIKSGPFSTLGFLFQLATLWPGIALLVKRIHDRNKSGHLAWLLYVPLIIMVVTLIGGGIALAVDSKVVAGTLFIISGVLGVMVAIVAIWFFIEFGCFRGTIGANRYGPDPVR